MRARRSSIIFWIWENAKRLRIQKVSRKKMTVQIIKPGMILVSGLELASIGVSCVIT